ncbi:MAG TPA: hypothetical protein VIK03_10050 [Thermoleophilia bacterium]
MHELGITQGIIDRAREKSSPDAPQPICPQCGSLLVQLDPEASMVQVTDVDIDDEAEEQP